MEHETMTKEEMQRFIDLGIKNGKSELEIFRELREVLGIKYDPASVTKDNSQNN